MKKLIFTSMVFAFLASSPQVQATSFNCGYAKLPSEVAICQNVELGRLDEIMAEKYFTLKRRLSKINFRNLKNEQKRWQTRRNSCGYNRDCLEDSYVYRIRALTHWLVDY